MCPPYPKYKEYPKDQSISVLIDCPECKGKMWLSEKKKGAMLFAEGSGKEILLACYDCFTKFVEENPGIFASLTRIDI